MIEQAVILAAGLGQRLGPAGQLKPKGLLEFGGQSLVSRSVGLLQLAGIRDIIVGTGHLAHQYSEAFAAVPGVACVAHEKYAATGSMRTLYGLRDHIWGNFLLLESDLLYEPRALEELLQHPEETVVLVSQFTYAGDECYVGSNNQAQLTDISKRREDIARLAGELVGISKVSQNVFENMCQYWEERHHAQPTMNYEDALVGVTSRELVVVHKADGLVWCEVDTPEHLQRAHYLYEARIAPTTRQSVH